MSLNASVPPLLVSMSHVLNVKDYSLRERKYFYTKKDTDMITEV